MIKTKKFVWSIFLAMALGIGILGALLFGLNTTSTEVKAETSTHLYSVTYAYYPKNNISKETTGNVEFDNIDELIQWTDYTLGYYALLGTFTYYEVTLNGDGYVYMPKTSAGVYNVNNKNFQFIDIEKHILNHITVGGSKSLRVTIKNAQMSPNITWDIKDYSCLYLENCVIDGYNGTYTQDIFNIAYRCSVCGRNSVIKNINFSGNTEVFDILTGGDGGDQYHVVWGDHSIGATFEVNNVHAKDRDGIIQIENNSYIEYVKFVNCSSGGKGGVCYINGGSVRNCIFENCYATDNHGGAVYVNKGYIDCCTFNNCKTLDDDTGDGGAVYLKGDDSSCCGSTFNNNTSEVDGGAICVKGDDVEIDGCHFNYNHAKDDGGAVYVCSSAGDTHVYNCTFKGNWADDDCDNVDECSDTLVKWCSYGSTISEGSIFLIIEIVTVLIAVTAILVVLKLRPKIKNDKEET